MLVFDVELTTTALSVSVLSQGQQERHDLIQKLHNEGLRDADIADYLNERNIKTPKGKQYYRELVSVTRKKVLKRNLRKEDFSYEIKDLHFEVKESSLKKLNSLGQKQLKSKQFIWGVTNTN